MYKLKRTGPAGSLWDSEWKVLACFEERIKECDLTSPEKVKFRVDQIEF